MRYLRRKMLGIAFLVPWMVASGWAQPPLGMKVVYRIDTEKLPPSFEPSPDTMDRLADVLDRRLGSAGRVLELNERSIEVGIFEAPSEKMQRIVSFLERPGMLEARVLANPHVHKELIEEAQSEDAMRVENDKGQTVARWVPVHPKSREAFEGYVAANEAVSRTPETENGNILEILMVEDELDVTEKYIEVAHQAVDEELNPCIHVLLSKEGGQRLALLTSRNLSDSAEAPHRKLAFIFDGRLRVAQNLNSHLRDRFRITGLNCGKKEVRELAWALYTGALPVPICKAEEQLADDSKQE